MRVETHHPAEDCPPQTFSSPSLADTHIVLRCYQHHTPCPFTDQAQACIPAPAPSQTRLSPIPSLTPVHAEVALRADGLDEAVRPVAKGMTISCVQLDPGPESGKGSQQHLCPVKSSRAHRKAKHSVREMNFLRPVLPRLPFIKQQRRSERGAAPTSLLPSSHSHAGIHALAILLVLQPCLSQVDGEHAGDPN